jgi:hypothetical protein
MAIIPLSQGYEAIIDDDDFARLSVHTWWAHARNCKGRVYVRAYTTIKKRTILMHRFILDVLDGVEVDHIDRNPLNNVRANLRLCSRSLNCANSVKPTKAASGYRGVYFDHRDQRWSARVFSKGQSFSAGYFSNALDAARSRDALAKKMFGEFAVLNFPDLSGVRA